MPHARLKSHAPRVVPKWAASLITLLVQYAPPVVSAATLADYLEEAKVGLEPKVALARLVRIGWLRKTRFNGAYAFLAPGVEAVVDPYIDLRAWRLIQPHTKFLLAGASAAWHLSYLDRMPEQPTIWLDAQTPFPKALRGTVARVTTPFPPTVSPQALSPTLKLLRERRLDLLRWAEGLPAFGPEALLVQISARPASFSAWVDLAGRLHDFCGDIDLKRLAPLLEASTDATRQRAAYLLRLGGKRGVMGLLPKTLPAVKFDGNGPANWDPKTGVSDSLVAPLLNANAKA
jgi:hypothetical protein